MVLFYARVKLTCLIRLRSTILLRAKLACLVSKAKESYSLSPVRCGVDAPSMGVLFVGYSSVDLDVDVPIRRCSLYNLICKS